MEQMRRLLAVLVVFGVFTVACSGDERVESASDAVEEEAIEAQPPSEPGADPAEPTPDESSGAAGTPATADDTDGTPTTIPAEEMMLDELNVGYFVEWPTPHQATQAEGTYDEVLGMMVNWVPFTSSGDMARAMEAGHIDISYSQGLMSFATFVTVGSDLLLVGVAASHTGTGREAVDARVFGIISTTGAFASDYPDAVTGFLQVNENAYRAYNEDREPFIDSIAEAAATDRDATIALLDAFTFPEKDAQLSEAWLGGTVQQVMKKQMDALVAQGEIESALGNYGAFVDTSFLETVS